MQKNRFSQAYLLSSRMRLRSRIRKYIFAREFIKDPYRSLTYLIFFLPKLQKFSSIILILLSLSPLLLILLTCLSHLLSSPHSHWPAAGRERRLRVRLPWAGDDRLAPATIGGGARFEQEQLAVSSSGGS